MRFLIVEANVFHGQVVYPLVEQLCAQGHQCELLTCPDHLDADAFERLQTIVPCFRVRFLDFRRPATWLLPLLKSCGRSRADRVLLTTVTEVTWLPALCLIMAGRSPSFILHNLQFFPSPCRGALGRRPSRLLSTLLAAGSKRILVLSRELAASARRRALPKVARKVRAFSPLPGRRLDSSAARRTALTLCVPGAVDPRRRNYASLIEALEVQSGNDALHVRIIGSTPGSDPETIRALRAFPQVSVELEHWMGIEELLRKTAECHAVLPLLDGSCAKRYNQDSVASALFLAHGLARPFILNGDIPLEDPHAAPVISYRSGYLGLALTHASEVYRHGGWGELQSKAERLRTGLDENFRELVSDL